MSSPIETVGDIRKLIENLDDDYTLDISIMKELSKEDLVHRRYPYPWDKIDGKLEFHDIGYGDKVLCLGVYESK